DLPPQLIVLDQLAQGVQNIGALGVHIPGAGMVDVILADDGPVILYALTATDDIIGRGLFAEMVIQIEVFGIGSKTFVYPHIGDIPIGDVVGKPFMGGFVDDDKVEQQAPARSTQVTTQIAVAVFIAVGDRTLV